MWHSDDQNTVTAEYPLSEDMVHCLEEAKNIFGVQEQQIIRQALREFFKKHGIRHRSCV